MPQIAWGPLRYHPAFSPDRICHSGPPFINRICRCTRLFWTPLLSLSLDDDAHRRWP